MKKAFVLMSLLLALGLSVAKAADAREIYKTASASVLRVSYVIETEQKRQTVHVLGTVVGANGLIVTSGTTFPQNVPMESFKEIEIHVNQGKVKTVAGEYLGQDAELNLAFILAQPDNRTTVKWTPVIFDDKAGIEAGDEVVTVGMLPEKFGYRVGVATGIVSVVIDKPDRVGFLNVTGLATYGAPVYSGGKMAIGLVSSIEIRPARVMGRVRMPAQSARVVVPASRFSELLARPPRGIVAAKKPWLGVVLQNLGADQAEFIGLKGRKAAGVGQVIENSPAAAAGLKPEDAIVALDGKPLDEMEGNAKEAIEETVRGHEIGDTVELTVWRDNREMPVKVKLAATPTTAAEAARLRLKDFGMTVRQIVLSDRLQLKLSADRTGLTVSYVEPGGWAQSAGIRPGDILTKLADKPIGTIADMQAAVETLRQDKPAEIVALVVRDGKDTNILRMEPKWEKGE